MTSNDAPVIKQNVVRQYIKNVGGVDRNDNLGGDYSSIKKSLKWRIKVALHYNQEATWMFSFSTIINVSYKTRLM